MGSRELDAGSGKEARRASLATSSEGFKIYVTREAGARMEAKRHPLEADGFEVRIDRQDGRVHLSLFGELDVGRREQFQVGLRQARDSGSDGLVIDLSGLTFIDSTGLGLIISAWSDSKREGSSFEMVPGSADQVRRTLALTGIDKFIPLASDGDGRPTLS
jgi:anti-sigma B factor antagonist